MDHPIRTTLAALLTVALCSSAAPVLLLAAPATQPAAADSAVDSILGQASNASAPGKAEQDAPKPPPGGTPLLGQQDDGFRPGTIWLSSGEKIHGRIGHTAGKPIRVWVEEKQEYRDVPFPLVKKVDGKVLWERQEREWHFKESGSDIKEYSGKSYPARETAYTVTMANGQTVTGAVAEPIYVTNSDGDQATYILHKRDKGEVGETLKHLAYITRIEFEEPAPGTTQPGKPTRPKSEKVYRGDAD